MDRNNLFKAIELNEQLEDVESAIEFFNTLDNKIKVSMLYDLPGQPGGICYGPLPKELTSTFQRALINYYKTKKRDLENEISKL